MTQLYRQQQLGRTPAITALIADAVGYGHIPGSVRSAFRERNQVIKGSLFLFYPLTTDMASSSVADVDGLGINRGDKLVADATSATMDVFTILLGVGLAVAARTVSLLLTVNRIPTAISSCIRTWMSLAITTHGGLQLDWSLSATSLIIATHIGRPYFGIFMRHREAAIPTPQSCDLLRRRSQRHQSYCRTNLLSSKELR